MRGRFFLDAVGRQTSFPRVGGRSGPTERVGTEALPDETAQAKFPEMRVRELERKAGEDEGLVRRSDVSSGVGRPPDWPSQNKGRLATPKRGDFPFAVSARNSCVFFWWFVPWATAKIVT